MPDQRQALTNTIEDFLREVITDLQPQPPTLKAGRPVILPALALWGGLLVSVTRGITRQAELWRLLTIKGLWGFPQYQISDQAVYKRLGQAASTTFQAIFEQVTMLLNIRMAEFDTQRSSSAHTANPINTALQPPLAAFASGVFSIDGMTLDRISKRLPSLRAETGTILGGKLSAIFDVRTQLWRSIKHHKDAQQNDKLEVREVIQGLPTASLLLFDLGFFAFSWFDHLTDLRHWFVSRMREKTSVTPVQVLYDHAGVKDSIVFLGAYRADRAGHAVRLVEVFYKGATRRYLTNVLDPRVLSVREVLELYARRWDIEMMFDLVKTNLKLHFLMSSKTNVMLHQVFAVFTVAQVILGLRSELAVRAKCDVFEVSLSLFVRWVLELARDGVDPIGVLVERGRLGGIIRRSSRGQIRIPEMDESVYRERSSHMVLTRKARFAGKA